MICIQIKKKSIIDGKVQEITNYCQDIFLIFIQILDFDSFLISIKKYNCLQFLQYNFMRLIV